MTDSGKQSSLITAKKCLKVDLTKKLDSDKKNRRQQLLLMDLFHRNLLFSFRPREKRFQCLFKNANSCQNERNTHSREVLLTGKDKYS